MMEADMDKDSIFRLTHYPAGGSGYALTAVQEKGGIIWVVESFRMSDRHPLLLDEPSERTHH
jgi:hypothetical protein